MSVCKRCEHYLCEKNTEKNRTEHKCKEFPNIVCFGGLGDNPIVEDCGKYRTKADFRKKKRTF